MFLSSLAHLVRECALKACSVLPCLDLPLTCLCFCLCLCLGSAVAINPGSSSSFRLQVSTLFPGNVALRTVHIKLIKTHSFKVPPMQNCRHFSNYSPLMLPSPNCLSVSFCSLFVLHAFLGSCLTGSLPTHKQTHRHREREGREGE